MGLEFKYSLLFSHSEICNVKNALSNCLLFQNVIYVNFSMYYIKERI